jgi:hypothetical protein
MDSAEPDGRHAAEGEDGTVVQFVQSFERVDTGDGEFDLAIRRLGPE